MVSAVLLRRWQTDGNVVAVNLRKRTKVHRPPNSLGFVEGYVLASYSVAIEDVWSEVENRLNWAIAKVHDGTIFEDLESLEVLRRTMAIHLVRAKHSLRLNLAWLGTKGVEGPLGELIAMANDRDCLQALYLNRTGLHATTQAQLDSERLRFLDEIKTEFGPGGKQFAEQMMIQYERVVAYLQSCPLEIGVAKDGELVIGDNPAVTYDSDGAHVGILAGVSLTQADAFVLPLTPKILLSIGRSDQYVELSRADTVVLNQLQVAAADDTVYCRVGSGLDAWLLEAAPQVP